MGWTNPKTYSAGEVATSADFNTYIRDNVAFLGRPPSCAVYNTGPASISASTFTAMAANTEKWDTDSMWAVSPNPTRIAVNTSGRYDINMTMTFNATATIAVAIAYRINGSGTGSTTQISAQPNAGGLINPVLSGAVKLVLTAGDYVEAMAWQNSAGSVNVTLNDFSATLVTVP